MFYVQAAMDLRESHCPPSPFRVYEVKHDSKAGSIKRVGQKGWHACPYIGPEQCYSLCSMPSACGAAVARPHRESA